MTRRGRLLGGVLMMAVSTAAGAMALAASPALAAGATSVPAHLNAHRIAFGRPVVVSGRAAAGTRLELQFLAAGGRTWQDIAATTAGANGRFRLDAPLHHSGYVRVVDVSAAAGDPLTGGLSNQAESLGTQHVAVAASVRVANRTLSSLGGGAVAVHGRLLPSLAGRVVWLEGLRGGAWHTLAATKTGRGGGFTLRTHAVGGREPLRVRFNGDVQNAHVTAAAGTVTLFAPTLVSWYYDAGQTACGFHAYYGVANKYLPCGTRVTLENGGRTVTATVDDRGPYVGARQFDLNQNTAAALGFSGVGDVWASF